MVERRLERENFYLYIGIASAIEPTKPFEPSIICYSIGYMEKAHLICLTSLTSSVLLKEALLGSLKEG